MKKQLRLITVALIAIFVLAACSSAPDAAEETSMAMESEMESSEGMSAEDAAHADETMADGDEMMHDDDSMTDSDEMMTDASMDAEGEMSEDGDHGMGDDGTMMSDDDSMASGTTDEAAMDGASDDAMTSDDSQMAVEAMGAELASWQQVALTDVRSGESFTLADFAGKHIFVETMATWCSNCRQQLNNVAQARTQLSGDDVVFIALSVETNLAAGDLAQYQQNQGFDWTFAVATPELLQMLADDFSRAILNPPSTPHFIIYPDGTIGDLVTGIESADQLLTSLNS